MSIGAALVVPLQHPGPATPTRRVDVETATVTERIRLGGGQRLIDAIDDALTSRGVSSAHIELHQGTFDAISYCIPAESPDGSTACWFSETHHALTPARVVAGSVSAGHLADGTRHLHAHVAWIDATGVLRGGHLWPDTVIGADGLEISLHALMDADLVSDTDPETMLPVFTPARRDASAPALSQGTGVRRRAVSARVLPGENLVAAAIDIARSHGFAGARIAGSNGSLVGICFSGEQVARLVEGPATEVVSVLGVLVPSEPLDQQHVYAMAADMHGAVQSGPLLPSEAVVAVTYELLVEEDDPR